ncbi:MAG: hypothetical protein EON95_07480 [Caulobacteraceae bacterium]|nr:MAG: hypothetical protein EON95_07480 [Caulobacteraceae bacterium]
MLIASAVSLALLFQSGSGLAFGEALSRADRYKDDPKAQQWRQTKMDPFVKPKTTALFDRCYSSALRRPMNFSLVVSFKDGKFDRVDRDSEDQVAVCMADVFAEYRWPTPPHPDFAEKFNLDLAPH